MLKGDRRCHHLFLHWKLNWMFLLNIFLSLKGLGKDKIIEQYFSMYMLGRSKLFRDVTNPNWEKKNLFCNVLEA